VRLSEADDLRLGTTQVDKVALGASQVYAPAPSGEPIPVSRFYLPSTGTSPYTPPFHTIWNNTGSVARMPLNHVKGNSAMASVGFSAGSTGWNRLVRQFVSAPLAAQTISGTVKQYDRAQKGNSGGSARRTALRVVGQDGTVRGVLAYVSGAGFVNGILTNGWGFNASALTPVNAQAGDLLVLDVGWLNSNTASSNGHTVLFSFGEDGALDLPEDTTTIAALNPWLEFSAPILLAPAV
jgi:hypothetical protein